VWASKPLIPKATAPDQQVTMMNSLHAYYFLTIAHSGYSNGISIARLKFK